MNIDLFGRETVQNPWPVLERLRAEGAVVKNDRVGTWMITTDSAVRKVLMNPARFTLDGCIGQEVFGPEAFITIDDKAQHDSLRGVWQVAFQRGTLETMRGFITQLADSMIDQVEEKLRSGETVDAEAELCRHLPAYVIAYMLGVPEEDRADIVRWSDDIGEAVGLPPNASRESDPIWLKARTAKAELADYLSERIAYRRENPGDDLISQIVHSDIGKTLPHEALVANSRQLLFAGNETTAKWLGHSLVVLAQHPDVRALLAVTPGRLGVSLEEVIRWQPVSMNLPRKVRGGDIELEGVTIPDGAELAVLLGSANRDEARFERAELFDIDRPFKSHLGFGYGLHNCLGVTLARLETEVVISRVLARIPDYVLAGEVTYSSFSLRGPQTLPIAMH